MGTVTIETRFGDIDVKIAGDTPTFQEYLKLDDIKSNPQDYVSSDVVESYRSSLRGEDEQFDYSTGVQDTKLRRMLGRADTKEDEERVLKESFGLSETEFTRDRRGRLALTPEGAQKFGIETDIPVLIDEKGFTRQDLSDLSGLGTTVAGGVTGAVAGSIVGGPIGGIIGAGLGGAGGKSVEEATEALQGVQAQEGSEIAKDIAVEGLISAAGEGIFAGLGKAFRVATGAARTGKDLPEEQIKTILDAKDENILPSLSAIGAPSLVGRQQAISEKALGTSARLRKNHEAIMKKLSQFRNEAGEVDVQGVSDVLTSAAKAGDDSLSRNLSESRNQLLTHMQNIADNIGRAADTDKAINEDLFKIFQSSYRSFDDLVETEFETIGKALKDSVGEEKIFNTGGIASDAAKRASRFTAAQTNTTPAKARDVLNTISNLGDNASFSELYFARKSLRDTGMFNSTSDTVSEVVDEFLPRIDTLLSKKNLDTFINKKMPGPEFVAQRKLLRGAVGDLNKARDFYSKGNKMFEQVNGAINKKTLINSIKNDVDVNPKGLMNAFVQKNNPKLLQDAEKVVDKFKGEGSFAPLRDRIANEWVRENLSRSINLNKPDSFSASAFKTKLDNLGSTADELFGPSVGQVRDLADQLNALSLTNVSQSVIDDFARVGGDDVGIGLLRSVKEATEEQARFNRNNINKRLKSGDLTPTEAADLVASGSMRAEDIAVLRRFFADEPEAMSKIQAHYMDNLIGDFETTFLTDKTQFAKFGDRLIKSDAKLKEIYGDEMAAQMTKFGRVMKLLGQSAEGGDLVAANIAASPLENLGTILRLSIIGRVFSSQRFYDIFFKRYEPLVRGTDARTRGQIVGELLSDAFSSAIAQGTAQSIDQAVEEVKDQTSSLMENNMKPPLKTRRSSATPVPQVLPPVNTAQVQPVANQSIRQRAKENPAVAATLLGGLGSAGLL